MKKFLVLSVIVGLAGIGVGVARQQDSADTTVEAATSTTATTATTIPATNSPTTVRKQAVKAPATTTTAIRKTTAPAVASTTSTSTNGVAPTTTTARATTTSAVGGVTPTCSVTADQPSVVYNASQVIRLATNMPNTPVTVVMIYPKATANGYPQQFNHKVTTDASGGDVWSFKSTSWTAGTVTVSVSISPPGRTMSNVCRTTFQSKAI
jgi:hypothetical protein